MTKIQKIAQKIMCKINPILNKEHFVGCFFIFSFLGAHIWWSYQENLPKVREYSLLAFANLMAGYLIYKIAEKKWVKYLCVAAFGIAGAIFYLAVLVTVFKSNT